MKAFEKEKAIQMRKQGASFSDISTDLGVSKGTLSKWLQDILLTEEEILNIRRVGWEKGQVSRDRYRKAMKEKRERSEAELYKKILERFNEISENSLFIAGLTLYEAEGDKKSRSDISFTNTDPRMLVFFICWAEKFLNIPHDSFRVQLHLYENMNIFGEEEYWLLQLRLKREQLWKTQIRPIGKNSFTYQNSSRHGTCKVYYGSVPKKTELRLSIQAFFDTYSTHMRA